MTRREIEYIAKLAASQANASGMSMPLAGEVPSKTPNVAPNTSSNNLNPVSTSALGKNITLNAFKPGSPTGR